MHFPCHFLSVFMVTWSQNEPSENHTKSTQLTITLRRVTGWPYFYVKWVQRLTVCGKVKKHFKEVTHFSKKRKFLIVLN